jgi:hypothetical protein
LLPAESWELVVKIPPSPLPVLAVGAGVLYVPVDEPPGIGVPGISGIAGLIRPINVVMESVFCIYKCETGVRSSICSSEIIFDGIEACARVVI